MNLRTRLVVGVLATALPVALLASGWEVRRERERASELLRERALVRFEIVGRESCEAEPASFPDAPRALPHEPGDWLFGEDAAPLPPPPREGPFRYFVFDVRGRPHRDDAPRLPPRVLRRIADGAESVSWIARRGHRPLERTWLRLPWSSPSCAGIVVEHLRPPAAPARGRIVPALLVTVAVALAVLAVAWPIVARIRRLTEAVREGRARGLEAGGGDEVAELGRAFAAREATIEAQIAELEAREKALRDHLAATSHDILLPVTVLQGHLVEIDLLRAAGDPIPVGTIRDALEETHYLVALVRDLNAEARLRSGMLTFSKVELAALVARVQARHAPIADRAGIAIEVATPERGVEIDGDPTLIEQMISNLVHNAVRYGHDGGHVAVVLQVRDGRFRLEVLDDGPGVPEALMPRLTERAFRTDEARTRRPEGTGLGLHIVREIAERHGFALAFERNEPTGLRASIEGSIADES